MLFLKKEENQESLHHPRKSNAKNHPIKNRVNGTRVECYFPQDVGRLKITQPNLALTAHKVKCYFQKKSRTKTYPVKNTINATQGTTLFSREKSKSKNQQLKIGVNGTEGTMLFSQERVRLKITQSKIVLRVHRVQCYFPKQEENQESPIQE